MADTRAGAGNIQVKFQRILLCESKKCFKNILINEDIEDTESSLKGLPTGQIRDN